MKKLGLLVLFLAMGLVGSSALAASMSGAIFTTDSACTGTNVNLFDLKTDVNLDGGPHHEGSAGLPEGFYYVQVTDPSGKNLLGTSIGAANQTPLEVDAATGKFKQCYKLWDILVDPSNGNSVGYADTTNNGGVYKVWVSKNSAFPNDESKTDNFKVKEGKTPPCDNTSEITVLKFDDSNANGIKDDGENYINWPITVLPNNDTFAPIDIPVSVGTWTICEEILENWQQTALIVDGEPCSVTTCAEVNVLSDCGDNHSVLFGNIQLGSIAACKFYDRNGNGVNNDEPAVVGIRFKLEGDNIKGEHIVVEGDDVVTGENGCVTFDKLLPGDYNLCEILPPDNGPDIHWVATTDACILNIKLAEGEDKPFAFGNVCTGKADFDTKGYWHNKNGLDETVQEDFDYLNTRAPWASCDPNTRPFGPINGKYCNGSDVPAVTIGGEIIAAAGDPCAEQSIFLVYKNSSVKLQLAQQLDAFIMNIRHRPKDNPIGLGATIQKPDGTWIVVSDLINDTINVWISGTTAERSARIALLDALNNSDAVLSIHETPCEVSYPQEP